MSLLGGEDLEFFFHFFIGSEQVVQLLLFSLQTLQAVGQLGLLELEGGIVVGSEAVEGVVVGGLHAMFLVVEEFVGSLVFFDNFVTELLGLFL
jgi:hypothetical protein